MHRRPGNRALNTSSVRSAPLAIARRLGLGLAVTGLFAALGVWALSPQKSATRLPLGLMTTLPIYWGERDYELVPLDTLAGPEGIASPETADRALLAQPRALSGPENVALDDWVRRGGHVLLFADPMLTSHSRFPIGDRRRPQDVVLLSPILSRWGLELQFDEAQAEGERVTQFGQIDLPVELAGTFRITPRTPGAPADCELKASGLVADCAIGQGRALIIADAAMLDQDAAGPMRENALRALTDRAFSPR